MYHRKVTVIFQYIKDNKGKIIGILIKLIQYVRLYELKHQHLSVCRPSKMYEKSALISKPQILHYAHQVNCNYLFFLTVSMKCSIGGVITDFGTVMATEMGSYFF